MYFPTLLRSAQTRIAQLNIFKHLVRSLPRKSTLRSNLQSFTKACLEIPSFLCICPDALIYSLIALYPFTASFQKSKLPYTKIFAAVTAGIYLAIPIIITVTNMLKSQNQQIDILNDKSTPANIKTHNNSIIQIIINSKKHLHADWKLFKDFCSQVMSFYKPGALITKLNDSGSSKNIDYAHLTRLIIYSITPLYLALTYYFGFKDYTTCLGQNLSSHNTLSEAEFKLKFAAILTTQVMLIPPLTVFLFVESAKAWLKKYPINWQEFVFSKKFRPLQIKRIIRCAGSPSIAQRISNSAKSIKNSRHRLHNLISSITSSLSKNNGQSYKSL